MNKTRMATMVIAGGVAVFLLKLLAYFISDSVALLSDALESIVNIVASVLLLIALIIAARPADESHRYGHQKAENISCLIEGILILIAAILIIEATVGRLLDPVPFGNIDLALVISLCATSLNGVMAVLLLRKAKKSGSIALEGDAKHLFSDVMSSVGVVAGLFIASITGLYILDPLIALVVAGLLIKMGIDVIGKTCRDLMDSSCPEEEKAIRRAMESDKRIVEYHDLKTRRSGNAVYADVHLCIEGSSSVSSAHEITETLTSDLEKRIPGIVMNIHIEPCQQTNRGRQ